MLTKKRIIAGFRSIPSSWIILLWLITIIGAGGSCSTSSTTDTGDDEVPATEGTLIQLNVVMGPLIGANVSVCPLANLDLEIASGTTEDATDIKEAGRVALEIPPEYHETPLFIRVEGGVDIDADDDGIRDSAPTSNVSTFEFVVPAAADLEDMGIVANPLLLFASRYLLDNLWVASAISEDFEPLSDPEAVRTVQRRIAKALLNEDINGDSTIGWKDLVSFHPLIDQAKCNLPWDHVLNNIRRIQQQYFSDVKVRYDRWFVINPHNFETIAVPDSDFPDLEYPEIPETKNNSMILTFITNKNDYKINDLDWAWTTQTGCGGLIWDELQVGSVILPDSLPMIFYTTQSPTSNGPACFKSGCLVPNSMPPLTLQECSYNAESEVAIKVAIGGRIFTPLEAEIGTYAVSFETTDGQAHQETVYVYENIRETSFQVVPIFTLDDENRIDSVSLRFEDNDGNVLEDPPILWGDWWMAASSDFRGEGYYHIEDTYLYGYDYGICFQSNISILSPTTPFNPTSNDHKLYYEDVLEMAFVFEGGDGVQRLFRFDLKDLAYYPDIRATRDGQYLTFSPYWGNPPGEEVVSIKYQWGDATWSPMSEWIEVVGPSATVEIPLGATVVRYTAKGASGFYYLGTAVQWRPLEIFAKK